jgi:hypothetical protein
MVGSRGGRRAAIAVGVAATLAWATALGAAASTGTVDPAVWVRHVTRVVETCRTDLSARESGVAGCFGAITSRDAPAGPGSANGKKSADRPGQNHPGVAGNDAGGKAVPGPGAAGTAPGLATAPGQSEPPPGQSVTAPGKSGSAPGQSATPPGQSATAPGQSATAPGHSATAPGKSGSAPGHDPSPAAKPDKKP